MHWNLCYAVLNRRKGRLFEPSFSFVPFVIFRNQLFGGTSVNQQGFNQKRSQYLINNAREIFERLQAAGQLRTEGFFTVTVEYLSLPVSAQG